MARVSASKKKPVAEPQVEAPVEQQPVKKATRTTTRKVELAYVQFAGQEWDMAEIVKKAKEAYLALGNKAASMKKFCVYIKPEEGLAYYVVNDTDTGSVEL